MYRKNSQGWLKHLDFIVLDLLCLHAAFVLGYIVRHGFENPYALESYRSIAVVFSMADLLLLVFFSTMKNVLKRGLAGETAVTLRHTFLLAVTVTFYLFTVQESGSYSRVFYYSMLCIYFCLSLLVRTGWKAALRKKPRRNQTRLFLIVTSKNAQQILDDIQKNTHKMYQVVGMAVMDQDMRGQEIGGVPVKACREDVEGYLRYEWVDEILAAARGTGATILYRNLIEMGLVVHVRMEGLEQFAEQRQTVESLGSSTVLTYSLGSVTVGQAFVKRTLDILGGIAGCLITGILCILIGPAICISSPGPIFFTQTRVGRNGKKFKMYKFRSMYLDAEARKQEVVAASGLSEQMMFKLEEDPRIIGSKILPDGTYRKGIGNFIRDWSLDEFPQFFNVLKGDMSLVGTRPPTVDEWEKYESRHRARMAIRPGITGLWQVSGRSRIKDFEEVVELDRQYISRWSLVLDLKILLRTVKVVVGRDGAM